MPRDLKASSNNSITLHDSMTGENITFRYRTPTTAERVEFETSTWQRKGMEVVDNSPETKIDFALRILTGFDEGAFCFDGVPISANPENSGYRADWKELLKETAHDLLSVIGATVFLGTRVETIPFGKK